MSKLKKIKSKLQRQSEKLDEAIKYSFIFVVLTLAIVIAVLSIKLLTAWF
mgnify:CR=1 FL=1